MATSRLTQLPRALPSTYKLDPTTGQLSVLVANGEDAVVSPDRTRVAYVRDLCPYRDPVGICWAFNDLLTADPSGADERAVAHTADMVGRFSPDWSPKGPGSCSPGRPWMKVGSGLGSPGWLWPGDPGAVCGSGEVLARRPQDRLCA
jgi:hypothetical protein